MTAPKEKPEYPNLGEGVVLFLIATLAFIVILSAYWFALPYLIIWTGHKFVFLAKILGLAPFAFAAYWGWRKTGRSFQEVFPLPPVPLITTILGGILLCAITIAMDQISHLLLMQHPSLNPFAGVNIKPASASGWVFLFIYNAVLSVIVYELLFRGLMLRGFLQHYSVPKAILFVSIISAFSSIVPTEFLPNFARSVVLAWLFVRTGSLRICIAAQVVLVTVQSISLYFYTSSAPQSLYTSSFLWIAGSIIVALACVLTLKKTTTPVGQAS